MASFNVESLKRKAAEWGCATDSQDFAAKMDAMDSLKDLREDFSVPKVQDLPCIDGSLVCDRKQDDCVYMCGNSLGLKPKGIHDTLNRELDKWSKMGVYGHTEGEMPWAWCEDVVKEESARIVGAHPEEVSIMNGLTVNLHLLLISFYRPTPTRHKVLIEAHSFPSDHYAVESQIRLHGFDPKTSMICLESREGEETLRTEDILKVIEDEGDSIAVIAWTGVQYYTGQLFDMETIVQKAHSKGCYVGFDLAHAAGNVPLHLHDWGVDYACWCSYKYLNSGAGGIAGAFVHEKHANNDFPKLSGWWGHKLTSRFQMDNNMDRTPGVAGYRISNAPPLLCASLEASLQVFAKTSMDDLRTKSLQLTGYLEHLLKTAYPMNECKRPYVEIITPADPTQRGAQLSIKFSVPIGKVFEELKKRAVVLDKREPNVLRVAPAPIYNNFTDVFRFVKLLGESMHAASVTSY